MRCGGAKSFVDDLGLSRGVVLSRAATLLRSIETQPYDSKICPRLDGHVFFVQSSGLFSPTIAVGEKKACATSFFFNFLQSTIVGEGYSHAWLNKLKTAKSKRS